MIRVLSALFVLMFLMSECVIGGDVSIVFIDATGRLPAAEKEDSPPSNAPETTAASETAQEDASAETAEETAPAEKDSSVSKEPVKPPLSPEMASFRDQLRRTLSQVYSSSINAQSNLPDEVIAFCEAFGHKAEIASGNRSGQKVNGVGAMCWNYPCGGYTLLRSDGARIVARVGYGHQERPAQLLAMLARNRVPDSYEIRIGDRRGTVADLVASEKLACREGLDQSGALIGLAFYTAPGETWENDLGETWSVERLLKQELDRKADASRIDVIDRLTAISYALKQLEDEEIASEGLRDRAEKHVAEFLDFALDLQNEDGSWHPGFFAYRGTSKDTAGSLLSTGAILSWLVFSLPEDRLEDQRVVRGLAYLQKQLASTVGRRSARPSSALEVLGQMNAAHALSLYDVRYLTPRTPKEPAEANGSNEGQQTRYSRQRSTEPSRSATNRVPSHYSSQSRDRSPSQRRNY